MSILEIPFLDYLLLHISKYFKIQAHIENNQLVTSNDEAKIFFNFFTGNNIKLDIKVCESLKQLFQFSDFNLYFQRKNRVIIILDKNQLFINGSKVYAEMAHNHLLHYIQWDKICTDTFLNVTEAGELNALCEKENIVLDYCLSVKSKKLLLDILETSDGIEVVKVTKESCNRNPYCNVIDLSHDDDEDSQIIDLTDVYEREVILNNTESITTVSTLRPVIIDGNNIAFSHGCGNFNPRGVFIAVNYFIERGHDRVYVLVPRHRQLEGGQIFEKLEKSKNLIYTPSRVINNKRETSYEDKLILEAALGHNGVVISNDQYRDLLHIQKFKDIIINRLIPYTFVGDLFMIPDDPKGQLGPNLRTILTMAVSSNSERHSNERWKANCRKKVDYATFIKNRKIKKRLKPLKHNFKKQR